MRKLIYYIATTIDGFIADRDGNFDMFPQNRQTLAGIFERYPETCPAHLRDVLGITAPARHFDTVLMGAHTHLPAVRAGLTSAYPHLAQYVVTHRTDLPPDPTLTVVSQDPLALVRELKSQTGMDIWLCGGANLAGQLVDEIDEYHLKINPIMLGDGIPLLGGDSRNLGLELKSSEDLAAGVLLNTYVRPATGGDA